MLAVIDIKAELDRLAQRGVSRRAARRTSFAKLASFRDGGLFSALGFSAKPRGSTIQAATNSSISSRAPRRST